MRSVNRYGKLINREGAIIKALLARGMRSPNAERFLREAQAHCQTCAAAVHADEKPPQPVTMALERYTRFATVRFSESALRSAVKRSKMTSQEAIVEIETGRWDPFPDIVFPTPEPKPQKFAPPVAAPPPARPPSWREVREDSP
jgi:hypothetical protein